MTFTSQIRVDTNPMPGEWRKDGWALWSPLSSQPYLMGITSWTDHKSEAHVFHSLDTAVATAEAWSYFCASTSIRVIAVTTVIPD